MSEKRHHPARIVAIIIAIIVVIAAALAAIVLTQSTLKANLQGDAEITLTNCEQYEEQGAYATLELPFGLGEMDLESCDMVIDGEVDAATPGDYTITYEPSYFIWSGSAQRVVHVVDTAAPVITLNGNNPAYVAAGQEYQEEGYSAIDDYDGDITANVQVVNNGSSITYTVADSSGNVASAERTITSTAPTSKVVYLTFDDGPSAYTQTLLDTLARHNVKATFFVTGSGDSSLIAKEAAAGHSIGVHSATHDYNTIYASEDAYFADFEQMEAIIEQQTGSRTTLFRFPGGSSNTVSSFNPGIMTKLTQDMTAMGYQYFDWNVSSGDAGGTTDTNQVYQNVIDGIASHDVSVVLQHDSKEYSVAAVDAILTWCEQNGYTCLPLTSTSPGAHHGVNN